MVKKHMNSILKLLRNIILIFSVLTFVIFLVKLPINAEFHINFRKLDIDTTIPFKEIGKEIITYYKMLFSGTFGMNDDNKGVWSYILPGFKRTLTILSISLVLSIVLGIIKGVFDSKKNKPHSSDIKTLSTLAILAMPNVFLILLLQFLAVILFRNGFGYLPAAGFGGVKYIILPIVALTMIPMAYIARITSLSVDEAYEEEYVATAIGKGATNSRILNIHIIRNAFMDILDSFSSITTIIISTLLIVEYMFAYPGVAYMMFENIRDDNLVIAIAIILGLLYFIITLIFKGISYLLNPKLREGNN